MASSTTTSEIIAKFQTKQCASCTNYCVNGSGGQSYDWYDEYLVNMHNRFGSDAWPICPSCFEFNDLCASCCITQSDKPLELKYKSVPFRESKYCENEGNICVYCQKLEKYAHLK